VLVYICATIAPLTPASTALHNSITVLCAIGDDIYGTLDESGDVTVHRRACAEGDKRLLSYRRLPSDNNNSKSGSTSKRPSSKSSSGRGATKGTVLYYTYSVVAYSLCASYMYFSCVMSN
jgi:hypothetical protein